MVELTGTYKWALAPGWVTTDRGEHPRCVVLLHSPGQGAVVRCPNRDYCPIDYIEGRLSFKQSHLVVEHRVGVVIGGAVLDVEDPVGRASTDRGEDPHGAG